MNMLMGIVNLDSQIQLFLQLLLCKCWGSWRDAEAEAAAAAGVSRFLCGVNICVIYGIMLNVLQLAVEQGLATVGLALT